MTNYSCLEIGKSIGSLWKFVFSKQMDNFIEKSNLTYKGLLGTDHRNSKNIKSITYMKGFTKIYTKTYSMKLKMINDWKLNNLSINTRKSKTNIKRNGDNCSVNYLLPIMWNFKVETSLSPSQLGPRLTSLMRGHPTLWVR